MNRLAIADEIIRRIDTVTLTTVEEVSSIRARAVAGEFDGMFDDLPYPNWWDTQGTVMQPHQERVVTERNDLAEKVQKLGIFLEGAMFPGLPEDEKARLREQYQHMLSYRNVLEKRIAAFSVAA